jgi:hypothetical protein
LHQVRYLTCKRINNLIMEILKLKGLKELISKYISNFIYNMGGITIDNFDQVQKEVKKLYALAGVVGHTSIVLWALEDFTNVSDDQSDRTTFRGSYSGQSKGVNIIKKGWVSLGDFIHATKDGNFGSFSSSYRSFGGDRSESSSSTSVIKKEKVRSFNMLTATDMEYSFTGGKFNVKYSDILEYICANRVLKEEKMILVKCPQSEVKKVLTIFMRNLQDRDYRTIFWEDTPKQSQYTVSTGVYQKDGKGREVMHDSNDNWISPEREGKEYQSTGWCEDKISLAGILNISAIESEIDWYLPKYKSYTAYLKNKVFRYCNLNGVVELERIPTSGKKSNCYNVSAGILLTGSIEMTFAYRAKKLGVKEAYSELYKVARYDAKGIMEKYQKMRYEDL